MSPYTTTPVTPSAPPPRHIYLALFIFSAFAVLFIPSALYSTVQEEEIRYDFGEKSATVAPGETLLFPPFYTDEESFVIHQGWVMDLYVKVSGPEALIFAGPVEDVLDLKEELDAGRGPAGNESSRFLVFRHIRNGSVSESIPVDAEGQYMIAVHNTARGDNVSENRLEVQLKFRAYRPEEESDLSIIYRVISGALSAFFTYLAGIGIFLFRFYKDRKEYYPLSRALRMCTGRPYLLTILSILSGLAVLLSFSSCVVPLPLIIAALYAYSLPKKAEASREVPAPGGPPPLEATGFRTAVKGERIEIYLTLKNSSDLTAEDITITPILAPGHVLYGLGDEYITWITPGEATTVKFTFKRRGEEPETIPIQFRITYVVKGQKREFITPQYSINT